MFAAVPGWVFRIALALTLAGVLPLRAQVAGADDMADVVKMYGYVYDSIGGGLPVAPIKARLIFESQPYGSEVGIISSQDSTGYYEFFIHLDKQYRLDISASGHSAYNLQITPREHYQGGDSLRKDFYLNPEIKENFVFRLDNLIFEQGKANITPASYSELNRLVAIMERYPAMEIQLEGHTDFRGSKKLNQELSEDRVEAVKQYLVTRNVATARIKTKAFGGTRPLNRDASMASADINRRVEVRVLKVE
jgi:OmpA-OmpF porin, OOP family